MGSQVLLVQVPVPTLRAVLRLSDKQTQQIEAIVEKTRAERQSRRGRPHPPPGGPGFGPPLDGPDSPGPPINGRFQVGQEPSRRSNVEPGTWNLEPPPPPPPGQDGPPEPGRGGFRPGPPPGMLRPGGPMQAAEKAASEQIEAVLTAKQRKAMPLTLKALQTIRDARVPLAIVEKMHLTSAQIQRLAAGAGARWDEAKLRQALTPKQQEQIEPYLQPTPMGAPGGPKGPDGPGRRPDPGSGAPPR